MHAGYWLNHRFFKMCFTVHFWDNGGNLNMGILYIREHYCIFVTLLWWDNGIVIMWENVLRGCVQVLRVISATFK